MNHREGPPASANRRPVVMLVDDDEEVMAVIERGLRYSGFAVLKASSGADAIDLYHRHGESVDAVLMDVRMPGLDGPQTLSLLKAIDPAVRCFLMTGGDIGGYTSEDFARAGALRVFTKPIALREIAHAISQYIGPPRPEPTNPPSGGA